MNDKVSFVIVALYHIVSRLLLKMIGKVTLIHKKRLLIRFFKIQNTNKFLFKFLTVFEKKNILL